MSKKFLYQLGILGLILHLPSCKQSPSVGTQKIPQKICPDKRVSLACPSTNSLSSPSTTQEPTTLATIFHKTRLSKKMLVLPAPSKNNEMLSLSFGSPKKITKEMVENSCFSDEYHSSNKAYKKHDELTKLPPEKQVEIYNRPYTP